MLNTNGKILCKTILFLILIIVLLGIYFNLFYTSGEFDGFNKDEKDYTSYVNAVELAVTDVDGALELCSESSKIRNECFVTVAEAVSKKDSKTGLTICEKITDVVWKSECFFIIAPYLLDKNVPLASEVCEKSKMFKRECYNRLGIFITQDFENIPSALSICNELSTEFKSYCFNGLGNSIGDKFSDDISLAVSACDEIPIEFKKECFDGLSNFISDKLSDNISLAVSACDKIHVKFKIDCFKTLGGYLSSRFRTDLSSLVQVSDTVPVEFRYGYFNGLSFNCGYLGDFFSCFKFNHSYGLICFFGFGKRAGISESFDELTRCDSIADKLSREWCYRGFGRGLIVRYSEDISLALNVCNSLSNTDYIPHCLVGVSEGLGDFILDTQNISFVLDKCYNLSEFNSYCYERIGKVAVTNLYTYDFSKAVNICDILEKDFREPCFMGIGKGLGEQFLYNSSIASMKCEESPSPYNADCKQGLDKTIKFYNTSL